MNNNNYYYNYYNEVFEQLKNKMDKVVGQELCNVCQ